MMIYGYNSKLMGSGITIRDYSLGLLEDIKKARGTIEVSSPRKQVAYKTKFSFRKKNGRLYSLAIALAA